MTHRRMNRQPWSLLAGLVALLACTQVAAVQITQLSPQGETSQVRQLVARFDQPAVRFGDPNAAAPLDLRCTPAANGRGRWTSEREWVFDFSGPLAPGVRCRVERSSGFRAPDGTALTGPESYEFNTGGPTVRRWWPQSLAIEEAQVFLLELSGPATPDSVQEKTWCAQEGVGERIPTRRIDGAERDAALRASGLAREASQTPLRFATLQCARTLNPEAHVELVYGPGVASPSGLATKTEQRQAFRVQAPFGISFSCERENAQAACLPLRPLRLNFSAPVTRKFAAQVRLKGGGQPIAPKLEPGGDPEGVLQDLRFDPPFAERSNYTIELPPGLVDASGRAPGAGDAFPLTVAIGPMPPLAKFAAAPFGVVERLAEPGGQALMPVTVRSVEAALPLAELSPGRVGDLQPRTDAEIIAWYRKVQRYDRASQLPRHMVAADTRQPLPRSIDPNDGERVETRMVSLLGGQAGVRSVDLPGRSAGDARPFEVIGIPLSPGFHVLEIASKKLGAGLLDASHGEGRTMYVRTTALATNLAVHFKLGRENAMAWVTTLDQGRVVPGAEVRVSNCRGEQLALARTDARGIAMLVGLSPEPPSCADEDSYEAGAYFVSARARDASGVEDLAFTWSDWQRGIEPWRFNLPTSSQPQPDRLAHTVFDRTLLRAGEAVSMKHFVRTQTGQGLGLPPANAMPGTLVVTHQGSGQQFTQALRWRETPGGGRSSESRFVLPPAAKLGVYEVALRTGNESSGSLQSGGQFRVEEFRLPVLEGSIAAQGNAPLVATTSVPVGLQVRFVAGGPASRLPVQVSALLRGKPLSFNDYEDFSFTPPSKEGAAAPGAEEDAEAIEDARVVADKRPVTLDREGNGQLLLDKLPRARAVPRELLLEASYADPNGEVQTLRSTQTLWPASVVAGIKTEGWVSSGKGHIKFQALALDLTGKPQAGTTLNVRAIAHRTTTSRKRLVGGFYTYDNQTDLEEIGTVCSGKSDARGLLLCETELKTSGEVELIASATDPEGRDSRAAASVYITRQGELWFGGEDHDRIDLVPEKKSYRPGEIARLQVRSPFRFATALVSVEREGVLDTQVVRLEGQDPTVSVQLRPEWGPNVYVSVLALRGRLREVPWYSFFSWGWKAPREWWTAFWIDGREVVAPTALVDLSKPAYRLGVAQLTVDAQAHRLDVKVASDKPDYPVRSRAQIDIQASLPDGQPAANAEVALAAVDEALLELMPNDSWDLLGAMLQRRAWGVSTSTAQMEIVGRRHYGRKAVPAGGGGGKSQTRELLDTLLLWNPGVQLDAQGRARVEVPLNDALSNFRIVAIASSGASRFGTGQARIRSTQDLQLIGGLPPLVRESDAFRAQVTLRNTTREAMKVELRPRVSLLSPEPRTVEIPAGEAREVGWDLIAPTQAGMQRLDELAWEIEARDTLGTARDALRLRQRLLPAVPVTVQQASLVQLDGSFSLEAARPPEALPGSGGLRIALKPRLADGLDGVRDWFAAYPYSCLEQKTSRAIGLRDARAWQAVVEQLPTYLDSDGLASYFPPTAGDAAQGSDTLTAYLLAASHEAAAIDPAFALPEATREPLIRALMAFVEGRIQRKFWSPRQDLDVRKLAALEALSRHGRVQWRQTTSLAITPQQWPTGALIDWLSILHRLPDVPDRARRVAEANNLLKARLSFQGTRLVMSRESEDGWWWLMTHADTNAARLLSVAMDDAAWKDDLPRLASGLIARQDRGAWRTTTANLWGGLALSKFSQRFESMPVSGLTTARFGDAQAEFDWRRPMRTGAAATTASRAAGAAVMSGESPAGPAAAAGTSEAASAVIERPAFGAPRGRDAAGGEMFLPWPGSSQEATTTPTSLVVTQAGSGKPWLTVQSLAAVPRREPMAAGYLLRRSVTAVEQARPGSYARGDILRVTLEVEASADMTWVALTDPVPAGASILGSGLGRDSVIATRNEQADRRTDPAFVERSFDSWRAYYAFLPRGTTRVQYTVRLNTVGDFALPPTRVEALYAPEMFGELPNARLKIEATP